MNQELPAQGPDTPIHPTRADLPIAGTDAIVFYDTEDGGKPKEVDPIRLSTDHKAAALRDQYLGAGAFDANNPMDIDRQEQDWVKKDSDGRHAYQFHYANGRTEDVGRVVYNLRMATRDNPKAFIAVEGGQLVIKSPVAGDPLPKTGDPMSQPNTPGHADPTQMSAESQAILAAIASSEQRILNAIQS